MNTGDDDQNARQSIWSNGLIEIMLIFAVRLFIN